MKSTINQLTSRDFWRGLFISVATPVLTLLQQIIPDWTVVLTNLFSSKTGAIIAQAALAAGVSYLLKNLKTDDTKVAIKTIEKQGGVVQDANGNEVTVAQGKIVPTRYAGEYN